MASLDRELRAIAARGSSATVTPDALLNSVTARAARRRATTLAGASLGALAVIGLAATAALSLGHRAPPARDPGTVLGTVTIPFDASPYGAAPAQISPDITCGAPAPAVFMSAQGIEWSVRSWEQVGTSPYSVGPSFTSTLSNDRGDTLPASISALGYVAVRNGTVAGWVEPDDTGFSPQFLVLGPDSQRTMTDQFMGLSIICDPDEAHPGLLREGEYQIYPVLRVTASPEAAARTLLHQDDYSVPVDDPELIATLYPDSWDCSLPGEGFQLANGSLWTGMPKSLLCAGPLANVTVDRDARTVTLPYTSRYYTRSVEVTLIGEPATYSAPNPEDISSFWGSGQYSEVSGPITDLSTLVCGAPVDAAPSAEWGATMSVFSTAAIDPAVRGGFQSGASERLLLLPSALSQPGTVAYPEALRAWFLSDRVPDVTTGLPGAPTNVVIGTGTAVVNGSNPVPFDRFAGPSAAGVTFGDVRWCDPSGGTPTLVVFAGIESVAHAGGLSTETSVIGSWAGDLSSWAMLGGAE